MLSRYAVLKKKNGSKHASCVYCSKPKGRSKLEPDSDERCYPNEKVAAVAPEGGNLQYL